MRYRLALLVVLVILPLAGAQAGRTVGNEITDILSVNNIQFPSGCAFIAEDLYDYISSYELDFASGREQGFTFGAGSHVGIVSFEEELRMHVETVLQKSPDLRVTFLNLALEGDIQDDFIVSGGSFSTLTTECSFYSIEGIASCDCTS